MVIKLLFVGILATAPLTQCNDEALVITSSFTGVEEEKEGAKNNNIKAHSAKCYLKDIL
jgi:hypothetical protein